MDDHIPHPDRQPSPVHPPEPAPGTDADPPEHTLSGRAPAEPPGPRPAAFVLSGGANLEAAQVGMLRALVERGIRPDVIVGCSIGAINGAALAQDPTPAGVDRLEHVWKTTDAGELMPRPWLPRPLALLRRDEATSCRTEMHRLLERTLTAATFTDLVTPLHCVATDVRSGAEAWLSDGPLADALLASAALPSTFPPVIVGGRRVLDGALVDDVPIRRAVELGARTLYVLEVGPPDQAWSGASHSRRAAVDAYRHARRHRLRRELEVIPPGVDVHLMPHGDLLALGVGDFTHSAELIAGAHRASSAYLASALQGAAQLTTVTGGPVARRAWAAPPGRRRG